MAEIKAKVENTPKNYQVATWETVEQGDTAKAVDVSQFPDKSVQISGTEGAALTIALHGSMDGTNYFALTSDGATLIDAVGIHYVWENPRFIKPVQGGGDVTTDMDYVLGMSTLA